MPPVPSIRGDRLVRALEKAGSRSLGCMEATTSCVTQMAAAPPYPYIGAGMSQRERYGTS